MKVNLVSDSYGRIGLVPIGDLAPNRCHLTSQVENAKSMHQPPCISEALPDSGSPMDRSETPANAITEAAAVANAAGLSYVCDTDPGIRRRRQEGEFVYVAADDALVADEEELARIRGLAIPPAYEDVWICANRRGHLQATGRDARGRKQYRYHPDWRRVRDSAKFDRTIEFGEALPRLRRQVRRDLALHGLPRDKVLALVVSLLDATRIRIGNECYARDNASYGLTTLRNRHARFVRDGRLILQFLGKGGAAHEVPVDDRRLVRLVRRCQQLPGQQLFQYVDDDGARHPIASDQVNDYLREAMGADFTAKDFRTWVATLRAIALLAGSPLPAEGGERELTARIAAAIRTVASELRNTPTVCRKSYINPTVFDAWRNGRLHHAVPASAATGAPRKLEAWALRFLRGEAHRDKAGRRSASMRPQSTLNREAKVRAPDVQSTAPHRSGRPISPRLQTHELPPARRPDDQARRAARVFRNTE